MDHPLSGTWTNRLESGWENSKVVAVDSTVGECVDEIDKLAELIGEHEAESTLVVCKSLTSLTSVTNLLHSSGRVF
ncbi:hypothetical protein Tco_0564524 [Tanacetum coccineum]